MGGTSYGDICASDETDFTTAASKSVSAHAGSVVQVLTGIMFDMHNTETRSVQEVWCDLQGALDEGSPCFAGTLGDKHQKAYDQLEEEHNIKLYCNHCYVICSAHTDGDDKYLRLRNPHNRLHGERNSAKTTKSKALHKAGTLVTKPKVHRMNSITVNESALMRGQEFDCTVEQFKAYFHTYEVSRRGVTNLLDRKKSTITFAGIQCHEVPMTQGSQLY